MTEKELFEKNQKLSTEFDLDLLDHPELLDKIPENALIVLLPEFDQELKEKNLEMARLHREKEQPLVYVKIDKMRASRLEGLQLEVAYSPVQRHPKNFQIDHKICYNEHKNCSR